MILKRKIITLEQTTQRVISDENKQNIMLPLIDLDIKILQGDYSFFKSLFCILLCIVSTVKCSFITSFECQDIIESYHLGTRLLMSHCVHFFFFSH